MLLSVEAKTQTQIKTYILQQLKHKRNSGEKGGTVKILGKEDMVYFQQCGNAKHENRWKIDVFVDA